MLLPFFADAINVEIYSTECEKTRSGEVDLFPAWLYGMIKRIVSMSDNLNPSSESPAATVHSFSAGTKSFC